MEEFGGIEPKSPLYSRHNLIYFTYLVLGVELWEGNDKVR